MKEAWALLIGLLAPGLLAVQAQYGVGIAGGTWEGVWGVAAQPAALMLNPDRAEINLFRVGADLDNSYLFLGREELGLFGFGRRIRVDTARLELGASSLDRERAVSMDARFMGPSFSLRLGDRHAVAFSNSVRVAFTALDLDDLARKFGIDTITVENGRPRRVSEATIRASALSWTEHALSYARTIPLGPGRRLHLGISAKYLLGIYALSVENEAPLLSALNDSVVGVSEVNLRYAAVTLADDPWKGGLPGLVHGHGWGMDAGVIYEVVPVLDSSGTTAPGRHALRLAASVTDVGHIHFTREAHRYAIRDGRTTVPALEDFSVGSASQLDTALSSLLLGSPYASRQAAGFRQYLPTALHASADYSPVKGFALRLAVVTELVSPTRGPAVREQLSLTPRFETRNFCAALPVSIDAFGNWGFGAMLRVGGFMIGTDRIGGLFGVNDLRGADLYFGAKVRLKGRTAAHR